MTQKSFLRELGISVVEREQAKQRDGAGGSSDVREQGVAGKPDYAPISPPFPKRCDQHCKSTILKKKKKKKRCNQLFWPCREG